jgi:hypothetical protein
MKIEYIMKVREVSSCGKTADGKHLSNARLEGDPIRLTLENVDESVARVLAGHIFGKAHIIIECVDES